MNEMYWILFKGKVHLFNFRPGEAGKYTLIGQNYYECMRKKLGATHEDITAWGCVDWKDNVGLIHFDFRN